MSPCYPFRPIPGQFGPHKRGPYPAPPFNPQDYWATRKLVSSLFGTLDTTKLDKVDVVDPSTATEDGKAAEAKSTCKELTRISGVASDALVLAESKADKLSSQQLAAVNSGIDADKVAKIAQNEIAISSEVSRATTEEARLRALVNAIKTFEVVISDSLPSPSEQYSKKLYLIPSTNPETKNVKDEFICVKVDNVWLWEQVGSTAITIEFDNEPTEGSQKAARSGGIWSWVKSLLPHWLTSDYAEPATVASVAVKADESALNAHVTNTNNPHAVTAEQIDAVPLVEDDFGEKTAVTIGSRNPESSVGPYSLANGDVVSANGIGTHAEGYLTTAWGLYSHASGVNSLTEHKYAYAWNGDENITYASHGPGTYNINPAGGMDGFYIGEQTLQAILASKADKAAPSAADNLATLTADGNLADSGKTVDDFLPRVSNGPVRSTFDVHSPLFMDMDGYIRLGVAGFIYGSFDNILEEMGSKISLRTELDSKADRSMISATNTTFSNAVLAVGLNIDTNSVAVLNEIAATFGGFPIEGTATTIGGLLAALAAAVAWLKKNKVGSFQSVGGASATVGNGVANLSDFFTESTSYTGNLPTPTGKLKNTKLDQAVQIVLKEKGGEDEKTQIVFSAFAKMDDFTEESVESDSFDVAITKLSQLLGEDVAA